MIIPYQDLEPDTLNAIIEHFVLREGTDYGDQERSMEEKVTAVKQQLKTGLVVLVYSELHETVNILPRDMLNNSQESMLS